MRIKLILLLLVCFLLSNFNLPAIACPPGDCDDCETWNEETEVCDWDCSTGQCCEDDGCVDDCSSGKCCDDGDCVSSCPTGECCDDGDCESSCPSGECCDDGDCVDDCPTGECCDDGTCVSSCPTGNCCSNGTCVSSCPTGKCCNNGECVFSCPTGWCCDDGTCVSSCPTGKCCSNGECVTSCPSYKCCYNGECVISCPTGWCCDDGTCVSSCPTGECCDDEIRGSCVATCPGECKTCMSGFCKDDDNECETCQKCVEGHCIACSSLGMICCDGECREPCDEEIEEPQCPTDWNEDCIACVGPLEYCSHDYTRIFTNAVTYNCSGGCDGECAEVDPQPVCSRNYKCKTAVEYTFAECSTGGEIQGPLDCYAQEVMPWDCDTCTTDYDELISEHYPLNPSERCQE